MVNSRRKGKAGELEWAHYLTDKGHPARRGQQFSGGDESPDVICKSLPVHWEVKRTETFQIDKAFAQATEDAGSDKIPVVAHRKSRGEWVVVLSADDFMRILGHMPQECLAALSKIRSINGESHE